jgi:hypothetical protein
MKVVKGTFFVGRGNDDPFKEVSENLCAEITEYMNENPVVNLLEESEKGHLFEYEVVLCQRSNIENAIAQVAIRLLELGFREDKVSELVKPLNEAFNDNSQTE